MVPAVVVMVLVEEMKEEEEEEEEEEEGAKMGVTVLGGGMSLTQCSSHCPNLLKENSSYHHVEGEGYGWVCSHSEWFDHFPISQENSQACGVPRRSAGAKE